MERIVVFYDYGIIVIVIIIILIIYILIFIVNNNYINRFLLEGQFIELVWTLIPIFFLIFLAFPSLKILYLTDEINNPLFTFKVIGHQWYWEYEYNLRLLNISDEIDNVDSIINKIIKMDSFRLLDVSEHFFVPIKCQVRLIILSDDVIHSFAVPALGIKVDAVPGRLNQIGMNINRPGLFFGQCSEICGVNHRFIPIVIESLTLKDWLKKIEIIS